MPTSNAFTLNSLNAMFKEVYSDFLDDEKQELLEYMYLTSCTKLELLVLLRRNKIDLETYNEILMVSE